ncbi:MAG: hypothetical protein B5M48_01390 [Candidatus Omnitrophica bacterium 4484_213]|nr:MAG: hypothetical protein B5M48_01390 [Candidatus Omnitrophica bacterium 4484_213]
MKALALFSGGLDSVLAAKLILEQGIEVIGVNFITPFFAADNQQRVKQIAADLGIELKTIALGDEYIEIVKSPKYGYGKNLNPCLDCRILMLKRAKGLLQRKRLSFIITGEVLGQRPMSQHKNALALIEKESNLKGLILRPLSAKLLPLTLPEKENRVDREKLLDIQGRSRKAQMELARKWRLSSYFSPSGGCLLTDPIFSQRMRDLLRYQDTSLDNIELLKIGRHFRLSPRTKLIVGRDERENNFLVELIKTEDVCFRPIEVKGPIGIGKGNFDDSLIGLATQIIARYCDEKEKAVEIGWKLSNQKMKKIKVMAMSEKEIEEFRI